VGPGKHFFGCAHTLRNYETAYWDSGVSDNNSFEQWRDAGEKTRIGAFHLAGGQVGGEGDVGRDREIDIATDNNECHRQHHDAYFHEARGGAR